MERNEYKTKYEETLVTIFQFSLVFMDYYEKPPEEESTIDDTIKDFLVNLNEAVEKDEDH